MTENHRINYSADALGDLREIYNCIANELLALENAVAQVKRIRKKHVHWQTCRNAMFWLNGNPGT